MVSWTDRAGGVSRRHRWRDLGRRCCQTVGGRPLEWRPPLCCFLGTLVGHHRSGCTCLGLAAQRAGRPARTSCSRGTAGLARSRPRCAGWSGGRRCRRLCHRVECFAFTDGTVGQSLNHRGPRAATAGGGRGTNLRTLAAISRKPRAEKRTRVRAPQVGTRIACDVRVTVRGAARTS